MRLKVKSSILAAVSALSLAAAARRKSKSQEGQERTEPRTSKLAMDLLDLNEASKEEIVKLIAEAGFEAVERDTLYHPLRQYAAA